MGVSKVIAITAALAALAGCATTHGNLSSSAERLERNSSALARDSDRSGFASSSYEHDARTLADQAHDFRRVLVDRRSDSRDVQAAFSDVSRSYHALRDEVDRSENTRARANFKPVTEAYLDVEREMGGYDRSRRASRDDGYRDRDRDRRDRY